MHIKNIAHRDLKPDNFLKFKEKYLISDFGDGLNLNYEYKYLKNI